MTAVKERPSAQDEIQAAERRNRSLTIGVIVLAILLVGGAAWMIYDQVTPPVDAEVMEVIDSYLESWEQKDEEAIRGLVTSGFVISTSTSRAPT